MSMSENAEENDANQSKFYRVDSTEPVTDVNDLFDTLSKFLMKDKKRQISTEYLDEKDQIASRLTWNNLRKVANSVLDEDSPQRDPIPAWIDQKEAIVLNDDEENPNEYISSDIAIPTKQEPEQTAKSETKIEPNNTDLPHEEAKESKREAKKAKKEAKKARKRERAEKKAKKIKKEGKKRKRKESGDE